MKHFIDGIIVVEGTSDSAFLSSMIDAIYVETNGYEIPERELDFLKHLPTNTKIIILTDSDDAGLLIRKRINEQLNNINNVYVDIDKCNKRNKHGVAECDKDEIINVLKEHFADKYDSNGNLSLIDLMNSGVNDQESRNYLSGILHLGNCNNKTILKRLNFLKYKNEDILKAMEGYHGNK